MCYITRIMYRRTEYRRSALSPAINRGLRNARFEDMDSLLMNSSQQVRSSRPVRPGHLYKTGETLSSISLQCLKTWPQQFASFVRKSYGVGEWPWILGFVDHGQVARLSYRNEDMRDDLPNFKEPACGRGALSDLLHADAARTFN